MHVIFRPEGAEGNSRALSGRTIIHCDTRGVAPGWLPPALSAPGFEVSG